MGKKLAASSRLAGQTGSSGKPTSMAAFSELPPHLQAELRDLAARPDDAIDYSDIPPVRDWSGAERGRFYRPVKRQISLRLDADLLDYFERGGKGYQTRLNAALREWVAKDRKRSGGPA